MIFRNNSLLYNLENNNFTFYSFDSINYYKYYLKPWYPFSMFGLTFTT